MKKSQLNGKRKRPPVSKPEEAKSPSAAGLTAEIVPEKEDAQILAHVRMFTSLMEGRAVSRSEIAQMLDRAKKKRQPRMASAAGEDYLDCEDEKDSS